MKAEISTRPANEVIAEIDELIATIHDNAIAFEEAAAVHAPEDGLTTDRRALAALQRPERFPGEHQVARMWIQTSPTIRLFGRKEN